MKEHSLFYNHIEEKDYNREVIKKIIVNERIYIESEEVSKEVPVRLLEVEIE